LLQRRFLDVDTHYELSFFPRPRPFFATEMANLQEVVQNVGFFAISAVRSGEQSLLSALGNVFGHRADFRPLMVQVMRYH
jgi:hypothetical protein